MICTRPRGGNSCEFALKWKKFHRPAYCDMRFEKVDFLYIMIMMALAEQYLAVK